MLRLNMNEREFAAAHTAWLNNPDTYEVEDDLIFCELCEDENVVAIIDEEFYSCKDCVKKLFDTIQRDNPKDIIKVQSL
jgi:hypothetical protein